MTPKQKKDKKKSHKKTRESHAIKNQKHKIKVQKIDDCIKHTHGSSETELLMDEGLQAIYGNEEINFEKLNRGGNKITRILTIAIIVLTILASTSWAGFFVYTKFFEIKHDENFQLEITMEDELISGEITEIEIQYTNPTNVPIASLELDLNLPSAFRIYSFSNDPTNLDDLIWKIGSLSGMTDGKITVEGIWIAETPSETPVQVYATYKPANFNSNFEEIAVTHITTIQSTLSTEITGPEEASAGEILNYEISIQNTGNEPFENILVKAILPEGFYLENSNPEIEAGGASEWNIDYIDSQEIININFSGTFASDIESFQYFDIITELTINNSEIKQSASQTYTDVLQNDINIQLVANGATSETSVDINSNLRISIGIENTEELPIEDLSILLDFQSNDSIPITWSDSILDDGIITSDGIYWTIDSIEPGEKILINTSFPIDSELGVGDTDNFTVIASSSYEGRSVLSSPMSISINSEADLKTSIRYYDDNGAILGSGPLPPESEKTTTYNVIWTIDNSLHDLKNIEISASLPPHVTWAGNAKHDLGTINYNNNYKNITWKINSMSSDLSKIEGSFLISITPSADDIGSFIKLISGSNLKATDSITSELLSDSTDSLTTDLEDDLYANVEGGIVIE